MKTLSRKTSLAGGILAFVISCILFPMAAQAACSKTGPIVRVLAYDDSYSSTGCYIYMRHTALAAFYFRAGTTDDNSCTNAVIAATTGVDTTVRGDVASCPTPAAGDWGNLGNLLYLLINP